MDSVESQMIKLSHKIDILYEMISQLDRKIAPISSKCAYINNHSAQPFELELRISDYYPNGEVLTDRRTDREFYLDGDILPRYHHHQSSASNGEIFQSTLTEADLSSQTDLNISPPYLEDEQCCPSGETTERSLIHQDVLGNEDYLEDMVECDPPDITEDIQIRRLTAQLTAAYNRIAALEEQLVSKRMHV